MSPHLLLLLAMLALLCSHLMRATRLAPIYPRQYGVQHFDLLLALALAYAIDTFLPFRVGELVRTLYIGRRCNVRYSYVGATILAERLVDVICVGVMVLGLLLSGAMPSSTFRAIAALLLVSGVVGIGLAVAVQRSITARRVIWVFASQFRTGLCFGVLDFFWVFSEIITGRVKGRRRSLLLTPPMWALYVTSYLLFARAADEPLSTVVLGLLGSPLHPTMQPSVVSNHAEIKVLVFTLLPLLVILLYGFIRERTEIVRTLSALAMGRMVGAMTYAITVSDRFKQEAEYESFLISRFANRTDILADFGLSAIMDGTVQRLFPGGSDALTALVEVSDTLVIRKFAIGAAGRKLNVQATWLRDHRSDLPLVEVIAERIGQDFYSYDMPYHPAATDFYDVIHTSSPEKSQQILATVMNDVAHFHQRSAGGLATQATIDNYLVEKAQKNAQTVLEQSREWFTNGSKTYQLNNREYHLDDWQYLMNIGWMRKQIADLRTTSVHGDLTIENIIVNTATDAVYIIDPNSENIFNCPLIDWAKLMQSLHLGYEALNKAPSCKCNAGSFSLALTRSHAYDQLFRYASKRLEDDLGRDALREIAFHELIHYLRLTPYKLRKAPQVGLTFFACTSILLRQYLEEYA